MMGVIYIKGLGNVEIAGDAPTRSEADAIEQYMADRGPEPEVVPDPGGGGAASNIPADPQAPPPTTRTGFMPQGVLEAVRGTVEEQGPVAQFAAEASPSIVGTGVGSAVGLGIGGPPLAFVGGIVGGFLGEFMGQETGVAPQSNAALGFSAGGPVMGVGTGKVLQGGRKAASALSKLPPAATALARTAAKKATSEIESVGARIFSRQKGLMRQPASVLYKMASDVGAILGKEAVAPSKQALVTLQKELLPYIRFPKIKQAMKTIEDVAKTLDGDEISFDTLVTARQLVGDMVRVAESTLGKKLGATKQVYKALSENVDILAKGSGLSGKAARLVQRATKRAKLEFSVRDFERAVARFSKDVPGEDATVINIARLSKWLKDATNPKSGNYDKNLSEAFGDEIPILSRRLNNLVKLTEKAGSPAGAGSIVIRGQGAKLGRGVIGGLIGFGAAGPVGAGVGGLLGASIPEMLTAALMTRPGYAVLSRAARIGKKGITPVMWEVIGQTLGQALIMGER